MNPRPGKRRLAVVLSHPVQYYSPWFRWLASNAPFDLRVSYLWDAGVARRHDEKFGREISWDIDLLSGYESEFVPNVATTPGTSAFDGIDNPELPDRLRAWSPDAILVFGYAYRTHLRLIRRPPAPLVFRGDSHLLGRPRPSWLKRLALRRIYRRFAAVTYVGQANRDYFRTFGVPDSKLHFAPHCVDSDRFRPTPEYDEAAARLRRDLGLGSRRVVLFAGKFVPAKGPRELLASFRRSATDGTALVFVGDGEEQSALLDDARAAPPGTVHFLPFANQSEMPSRYALADILALPSLGFYETWGLAVNEAMHMGLPCLVSDRVGCQRDLVAESETGWVFHASEPASLDNALHRALSADDAALAAMKPRIAQRISGYTYERAAEGLVEAVESAIRNEN